MPCRLVALLYTLLGPETWHLVRSELGESADGYPALVDYDASAEPGRPVVIRARAARMVAGRDTGDRTVPSPSEDGVDG